LLTLAARIWFPRGPRRLSREHRSAALRRADSGTPRRQDVIS
jgi:hypothetical protein